MAITYPIQDSDRFTVFDTTANEPLKDGRGRPMKGVKWQSENKDQMIPNLAPNIKWLLEVKESAPAYDEWTEKLEKVTNYDVVNETATETYNVVALTQAEQDAKVPTHFTTAGGIKLATGEGDQNAFVRMNSLIDLAAMPPTDGITIKDVYGNTHNMTVGQYKSTMVAYGQHCYTLFLAE